MKSNASKSSSKKTKATTRDLKRSFDAAVLARAREIAAQYSVVLQPHARLGFMGSSVEIPTVFTHGRTAEECVATTREALGVAVAVLLEMGEIPPAAASEDRRDRQINVRLTAEEKLLLEHAAKRRGFRGISDFVRTAAMSATHKTA